MEIEAVFPESFQVEYRFLPLIITHQLADKERV